MKCSTPAAAFAAVLSALPLARAANAAVSSPFILQWKDALGLTDAQARRYEAAEKLRAQALGPLQARLRGALEMIRGLLGGKARDAEVSAALDAYGAISGEIAAAEKRFDDELATFLTPTQRAKLLVGLPVPAPGADLEQE